MGKASIYKEMMRSTGIYLLGTMARQAMAFLLIPVFTRFLTPKDAGIQELLDTTMVVFSMLAGQRVGSGVLYFLSKAEDEAGRNRTLSTILLGGIGVGIAGGLIGGLAGTWICQAVFQSADYVFYWRLMCVSFAVSVPNEIAWNWMRGENRATWFVASNLVLTLINYAIVLVLLIHYRMGFRSLVWGTAVSAAAMALVQSAYVFSKTGIHFDGGLFKRAVRYAIPTGLSGLGALMLHSGDRFFLQRSASLMDVGIYGYAYRLGMMISTLQGAFGNYWLTRVYDLLKGEGGRHLFERTLTYVVTVAASLGFFLWIWGRPFVNSFVGWEFRGCLAYYPWILAAYVIRIPADYMRSLLYLRNRTDLDAAVNVISAVACLGAYFVLIPPFGVWGAAWATLAGFSVLAAAASALGYRVYPYTPEWKRLLQVGVAILAAGGLFVLIPAPTVLWQVAVAAVLSLVYPAVLWISGFFDPGEREQIALALQRIRERISSTPVTTSS
ncbi:MAG: lipopolysaccharide biosynthesis protein [Bryobacteraceae bacterium]